MNGLKALPGRRISPTLRLKLVGASNCFNDGTCENQRYDLDGIDTTETNDECDSLASWTETESDEPTSNGNNEKIQEANPTPTPIDRDVNTFFEQFLQKSSSTSGGGKPQQPMAVLQSRYNTVQHQLNKQAQHKSIKGWFRYESRGPDNDSWKTSEIVIPDDIAKNWGLKLMHSSGQFQLTNSEMEILIVEYDDTDILLDLFGEYRFSPADTIEFKSKKGAQKSAALNLLLSMDLGDLPSNSGENKLSVPNDTARDENSDKVQVQALPKERFQLVNVRYHGAIENSEGEFLSIENPCLVKCIVSVKDASCKALNQEVVEVKSEFHQHEDDSLKAALDELKSALMARGATANDMDNVLSAINEKPIPWEYEMTLPKWSTAKIESHLFLYEVEFYWCKQDSDSQNDSSIPLSEAMDLDANAATRIGILLGSDLYEAQDFDSILCADFTPGTLDSNVSLHVRMCGRTEVTQTEMKEQIHRASPNINLDEGEGPISLAKCFNSILLDNGKRYGLGPMPAWDDILKILDEEKSESGSRTYLFLPICRTPNTKHSTDLEIDWSIVWDVVHHKSSAVLCTATRRGARRYLVASIACILYSLFFVARSYNWDYLFQEVHRIVIPTLVLPIAAVSVAWFTNTLTRIPSSLLRNRFLTQPVGFGKRVFIVKNEEVSSMTSSSALLPQDIISQISEDLKTRLLKSHGRLQLSHVKYYQQLRKGPIEYPKEPLIQAIYLNALSYSQHELTLFHQLYGKTVTIPIFDPSSQTSISNALAARGLLVPELTLALPLPRDMIYLCQRASEFMPKFERVHTLRVVISRLRELQRGAAALFQYENDTPVSTENMMQLIDKATSTNTNTNTKDPVREHERLETLGDSVLLFFIVLNLFAKHPSSKIQYVLDLFDQVINLQGRNKVLFHAATHIGLHRLVHIGNQSLSKTWRSTYKTSTAKGSIASLAHTAEISRKQMSDVAESLLGATYLSDKSGCMSVGLLNEMGSCLRSVEDEAFDIASNSTSWFTGRGTCLTEGYPFDSHSEWAVELTKIEGILQHKSDVLSALQRKADHFCQLLTKQTTRQDLVEQLQSNQTAALLLHCALFDDSLDDQESNLETAGLESFAKLRDKIFHVGNAALQLNIVSEVYRIFPGSSSGDFHLMKVTLLSNDSLAYILVKNGIHECLFDSGADAIFLMQDYMNESDLLGAKDWANHGDWVLPGGMEEFHKRIKQLHNNCSQPIMECPQYMGLAAGRLRGQKGKLPDLASEDLQFSMKCIVGALVLAFGVEDAWQYMLRPLFLELLLLSPDELRTVYKDVSPLASLCQKGRR